MSLYIQGGRSGKAPPREHARRIFPRASGLGMAEDKEGQEKREQPPARHVVLLESPEVTPGINRGRA